MLSVKESDSGEDKQKEIKGETKCKEKDMKTSWPSKQWAIEEGGE